MRNRFVLFVLLLSLIGACSDNKDTESSTTVATTPAAPAVTTPSGADIAVAISDFKFGPQTVNVPVGGSVVWTNNDGQQHTATSAGNFDAGAIDPQASMTVTFDTAGSFTYICSFHPFMTGTVVVG
jgi:plastocyanin